MANTIFITGAGGGIGQAAARLFHREGWRVGAFDVDRRTAEALGEELGAERCLTGAVDVRDVEQMTGAIERFGEWTDGRMDVLFNNAGILQQGRFETIALENHLRTIDVNLRGVVIGTYLALPLLRRAPDPCILSMSSASAVVGTPEHSVYSATKFGVRALTEALSVELERSGIRVVDLMPSFVGTDMVHGQQSPSVYVEQMGVTHTAEDIAGWALEAVRGKRVHWMTRQVWVSEVVGTLFPGLTRRWLRRALGDE